MKKDVTAITLLLVFVCWPGFTFAKTCTGFLSIQGSDFAPKDSSVTYSSSGPVLYTDASAEAIFIAPIHLPHGATIVKATLKSEDQSVAGYVTVSIDSCIPPSTFDTYCTLTTPTGSAEGYATHESDPLNVVIDNAQTSYYAVLKLNNGGEGPWKSWLWQLLSSMNTMQPQRSLFLFSSHSGKAGAQVLHPR